MGVVVTFARTRVFDGEADRATLTDLDVALFKEPTTTVENEGAAPLTRLEDTLPALLTAATENVDICALTGLDVDLP